MNTGVIEVPKAEVFPYAYSEPKVGTYQKEIDGARGFVWLEGEGCFISVICRGRGKWVRVEPE